PTGRPSAGERGGKREKQEDRHSARTRACAEMTRGIAALCLLWCLVGAVAQDSTQSSAITPPQAPMTTQSAQAPQTPGCSSSADNSTCVCDFACDSGTWRMRAGRGDFGCSLTTFLISGKVCCCNEKMEASCLAADDKNCKIRGTNKTFAAADPAIR